VTSLTAAFTTTDVNAPILATGITGRSYIEKAATPTTAYPWFSGGTYALGDIARPTASNAHLYQVTTAGTASGTQPTWPTSGGTVTDGTVVWQDLGTAATAAFVSIAATATGTALTLNWGRSAAIVTHAQWWRQHLITQGGVPSGAADAGAGTGPSGVSTTGTDHAFIFNVTTGTSPAAGDMFHVNPAQSWLGLTPKFAVTAGNAATATLLAGGFYTTNTGGVLTLFTTIAPVASTAYVFYVTALV
jgi:hypothetical protein